MTWLQFLILYGRAVRARSFEEQLAECKRRDQLQPTVRYAR